MRVVFFDQDIYRDFGYCSEEVEPLKQYGTVDSYSLDSYQNFNEMVSKLQSAEIIVVGVSKLPNELLENLEHVRFIQFLGIGASNFIDMEYCKQRNIKVGTVSDYGSNAVAEFSLCCAMALAKKIIQADQVVKNQNWSIENLLGKEIVNSVFGVVGTGKIGSLVTRKVHALGGKTIAFDTYKNESLINDCGTQYCNLEEIFSKSDFISIHLALNKDTKNYINGNFLRLMKNTSFLVNTSRAEVIDYKILYDLLANKKIAGAALDVFPEEPLNDFSLCQLENVISTPHIAYYTDSSNRNLLKKSVESIIRFLEKGDS